MDIVRLRNPQGEPAGIVGREYAERFCQEHPGWTMEEVQRVAATLEVRPASGFVSPSARQSTAEPGASPGQQ